MLAPIRPKPIIASCMSSGCHVFRRSHRRPGRFTVGPVTPALLRGAVDACAAPNETLNARLVGLTDDEARRPSLLPGWTVGHVLTHIARNADGLARMFTGAQRGEVA